MIECPACQHANSPIARYCVECGMALARCCPGCGAEVREEQRFCGDCGRALESVIASKSPIDEGERRHLTIVFSDLSGYTSLNERFDPEEVETIMARIKREASEIVSAEGGTINQFIGDEIMMLFGVPTARRDDPQRAVRAALALHQRVDKIAHELVSRLGRLLTMHTGINTGLTVVRSSDSRDGRYGVTGDSINTAARLLGLAGANEIVVGQETWRQISEEFDCEAGAAIEVKGKKHPITPYCVRGERARHDVSRRVLVGRAEEVRQFTALVETCQERKRGRLLMLRGDPGIGKSRLGHEFLAIARMRGFACHTALVLDFSAERGRDTVRSLVRSLVSIAPDADEPTRRRAIQEVMAGHPGSSERELFLCDLLDVTPPQSLRAIDSAITEEARHRGTLETLCELVRHVSARRPLVLLVEDIHWADQWTLARLASLAALSSELPLLVVLTTRFDGDPSAGAWRATLHRTPTTGIDLGPLAREDALRLTAQFDSLAEGAALSFVDRAEGNPLFLEQLLLSGDGSAEASLPSSVQTLVLSRMDRLSPLDRQAIQAAAVLGQRFSLDSLRHVMGHAEYRVATLVEHFLLRPEGQDFLFCHALIRDGAYESLLKSRRRQLHARAAEWFGEDDPVLAAEHYERAEHPQAARACLAASVLESSRCHFSAALAFAERGLKIAKSSEDCFELSCMRAMVLNEMGQANAAADAWRVALESSQGHTERCRALIGLAQALRIVDRSEDGFAALADAEALAREAQLTLELSRVHHLRGNYFFGQGRASECLQEHENALLRAREVACVEAEANALSGLGDAHYVSGRMRSASEQFQACVDLARRAGLGRIEVANRHMVGWSMHYLGGLRAALEVGLESIDMATRVSHLRVELIARLLVSYVGGCLIGDLDCGQAHLEASLKLCRQLGAKRFEAQNLTYRALLSLRAGERRVAEREARVALCFSREHGMKFFGAVSLGLLARLSGDATERIQLNGEAVARLKEGAISHNHFEFYVQAIESALERGAWDESERYCQALEGYTASERLPWSDFVIERGRRLVEAGRGERGQELLLALEHLRGLALRHEYRVMVPALEEAIASAGGPSAIAQAQPPERRAI